jgi:hypothetical protein
LPSIFIHSVSPHVFERGDGEQWNLQLLRVGEAADILHGGGQLSLHKCMRGDHRLGLVGRAHRREHRSDGRRCEVGRRRRGLVVPSCGEGDVHEGVRARLLEDVGEHGWVGAAHAQRDGTEGEGESCKQPLQKLAYNYKE